MMETTRAVEMLAALAQDSRLGVFRRLARAAADVTAGDLARELDVPANTLSFHLKELAGAGLIRSRRDGRRILFRLDQENVAQLMAFLLHDCCGGQPELCGPAGNAAARARSHLVPLETSPPVPPRAGGRRPPGGSGGSPGRSGSRTPDHG